MRAFMGRRFASSGAGSKRWKVMAAGFEKYLNASSGRKVAGRPKRSSHDSIHTKTIALEHFSDSGSVVALKFDFPVPNGPSAGQLLPRITGKLLDFVSADPRMES